MEVRGLNRETEKFSNALSQPMKRTVVGALANDTRNQGMYLRRMSARNIRLFGGLKGDCFVASANEQACVIDLARRAVVGRVPIEPDTDSRICFLPDEDICFVGSWRKGIRAWKYDTGELLWHSAVSHATHFRAFEGKGQIKVSVEGSIILDSKTGREVQRLKAVDLLCDPCSERSAVFNRTNQNITVRDPGTERVWTIRLSQFAVLAHCWSRDSFFCSGPEGELFEFSFARGEVVFNQRVSEWFNVSWLAFNPETSCLVGIAADWKGKAAKCLFHFQKGRVQPCVELPNFPSFCFVQDGRIVVAWDGSVFDSSTGQKGQPLDFERLLQS